MFYHYKFLNIMSQWVTKGVQSQDHKMYGGLLRHQIVLLSASIDGEYHPDCDAIRHAGNTVSGVYTIYPSHPDGINVYCDFMTPGGWIVSPFSYLKK